MVNSFAEQPTRTKHVAMVQANNLGRELVKDRAQLSENKSKLGIKVIAVNFLGVGVAFLPTVRCI